MSRYVSSPMRVVGMAIRDYYRDNPTGGHLHIYTDDGNYEHEHVEFCQQQALEHGDERAEAIADMLLTMTDSEREIIYEHHHRWGWGT